MSKTVLITGCSSGIGASLVNAFQKCGLTVFATARTPSTLSGFKGVPNVHILGLDVTSEGSIQDAYEHVRKTTNGRLDYLVNNAGRGHDLPALDLPLEEAKALFDANFWGMVRMCQTFAPLVVEAKGAIMNMGSVAGEIALPYMATYNASKAALHLYSSTLRLELEPFSVRVLTIVVGAVATNFKANAPVPALPATSLYAPVKDNIKAIARGDTIKAASQPEALAEALAKDLLSGKTGQVWKGANAGMARFAKWLFPGSMIDRMVVEGSGLSELAARER